jgi:hypothetical protein
VEISIKRMKGETMKYHFLDGFPVYVFFALLRGKPVNEGDKLHDQTQLRMVSCDIRMQIHAEDAVFFHPPLPFCRKSTDGEPCCNFFCGLEKG